MLLNLQLDYVRSSGYVNLRCVWTVGRPGTVYPSDGDFHAMKPPDSPPTITNRMYRKAFQELIPGTELPKRVGVSCCS
jgi:hypothetical protein